VTSKLIIDISVTFVPLHHMRKGTRLSPSLTIVFVMRGESLGTRLGLASLDIWPDPLSECVAVVHIGRFCFIYCGLRFYAQSHSDNGHVHAIAPCSAHALTQARPTMSYIPLV